MAIRKEGRLLSEFNMPLTFNIVTQEKFLHELARSEKYFSEAGKFVGLSHFIKVHLGKMGFDYRWSIKIAANLQNIGKIEFYKVMPPEYEIEVTEVRLQESSTAQSALRIIPVARSLHVNFMAAESIAPTSMINWRNPWLQNHADNPI